MAEINNILRPSGYSRGLIVLRKLDLGDGAIRQNAGRRQSLQRYDGVYLFEVKAFPFEQQTVGQFLGVGCLQFSKDTYSES